MRVEEQAVAQGLRESPAFVGKAYLQQNHLPTPSEDQMTNTPDETVITMEAVDALRASNEAKLQTVQKRHGQLLDPSGIILSTMIDHLFPGGDERVMFLWDLESRIAEALDNFLDSTSTGLLVPQHEPLIK